jgi:endonuclease/exonuclease/phosphatase family metal-dependent hydrolase
MRISLRLAVVLLVAALAAGVGARSAAAEEPEESHRDHTVTVLTYNLYLGTDLRPIFAAPSPFALYAAAGAGYAQVEAGRPEERMQSIASAISAASPDFVAIEEGTLFRVDSPPDGPASPAETVTHDLLGSLLVDLGGSYRLLGTFTGTDAELPAGLPPTRDVRLTDRVALLARTDRREGRLKVSNVDVGTYAAQLVVPTAGGPITVPRGWVAVDVKLRGRSFRVVATHLEAFSPLAQVAQAQELLAGPASTDRPVVIAGDFNSRADGLGTPSYGLIRAAGFDDAWAGPGGFTCCHPADLLGNARVPDARIDLILSRGGFRSRSIAVLDGQTPSGLWRSDHAGVVATLAVPKEEEDD